MINETSALKFLTASPMIKKVWSGCQTAYSIACLMVLPMSVMLPGMWLTQKASVTEISATAYNLMPEPAHPGQVLNIGSKVVIDAPTRKAVYRTWLEDVHAQAVYRYPSQQVEDPKRLSFGNRVLEIPRSIKPGVYTVVVEVEYALNPIKTARTRVEVAQVEVQ